MAKLKVTLKRSVIGTPRTQRLTVKSIGIRKLNSSVIVNDDPAMKGQLHKVRHLVEVEPVEE